MATQTGQFGQLLAPGLRKIFFSHLKGKEKEQQWKQIANFVTSTRAYEEDLEIVGMGSMPQKPEGEGIVYQDPSQGEKVRYTHVTYGLGFRVTEEMHEDDLYGQIKKMPMQLTKAALNIREVVFFNLLNNGFTSVYGFPKFGTNETIFNTAHTLRGGGTQANRLAVDADLGIASLEAAVLLFDNLVDEMGFPITIKPRKLVHAPALKQIVRELLGSEFKPYTNANEINAVKQDGFTPIQVNYLTNTNSWFLFADNEDHDFKFIERRAITYQTGDDFDSGDMKNKATQRFSVGVGEYRGSFASQGG